MAEFKLKAPRIRESDRQAQIIRWLRIEQAAGRVSWFARNNGGAVKTATQFVRFYSLYLAGNWKQSKGKADIDGMLTGGRYFAFEVKQPGEKATPEQMLFLATVRADGGIADVVYSFEDVERVLRRDSSMGEQRVCTPLVAGSSPALGSETKNRPEAVNAPVTAG